MVKVWLSIGRGVNECIDIHVIECCHLYIDRDDIVSEKSSYKVSDLQVSFTLVKVTSRKWGALEASQARGEHFL